MVKAQAGILESDARRRPRRSSQARVDAACSRTPRRPAGSRPTCGRSSASAARASGGERRPRRSPPGGGSSRRSPSARPLVLVFEDLHWADDGLLDFVDHLVDWARDVPLLVVCTARPELLDAAARLGWREAERDRRSRSRRSRDDETAQLVHGLLERAVLPADAPGELLERAGGNPLYAEEFARMLARARRAGRGDSAGDRAGDHRGAARRALRRRRRRCSRTRP